ncbi:uncharacterized protein BCR38DRAFT_433743 [Pseudomassariella vexata]|uniref:Uncharacterized protein n=1 Tax=Pseudomassariella vexata TaxID=1141098 RepID=A0A1Y2DZG8_9PEZI|nr:uncharacterized protein BCR38DRAFT_433743 [Pseudomassariella vexata]ORY64015.1 hypothetical protein BCR38DRAFT_433743 [Pseudomassariella vexata]
MITRRPITTTAYKFSPPLILVWVSCLFGATHITPLNSISGQNSSIHRLRLPLPARHFKKRLSIDRAVISWYEVGPDRYITVSISHSRVEHGYIDTIGRWFPGVHSQTDIGSDNVLMG